MFIGLLPAFRHIFLSGSINGLLIFIFIGCVIYVDAQEIKQDTIIELQSVTIQSSRLIDNTIGIKVTSLDSMSIEQNQMSNLADILEFKTPIYIKTYGIGSLATMSLRGTSSNQSAVYWNDIAISGPNDGMVDLSLIPVEFFRSINIQYGGASSLFGNGNIGGGIHLKNEPDFSKHNHFKASLMAGSYSNFTGTAKLDIGTESFYSTTALFYHQAKNDFEYTNNTKPGDPVEKLQNAANKGYGLIQGFSKKLKNDHTLSLDIWLQQIDRKIPSLMIMDPGNAEQQDKNIRTIVSWHKSVKKGYYLIKAAYFDNLIHYKDINEDNPEWSIDSRIHTRSYIGEGEYKHKFSKRFILDAGLQYRYEWGDADAYDSIITENRGSIYTSLTYLFSKINWTSNLTIRQGWTENFNEPFIPSVGFEGKIWRFIFGKLNISKNFRIPTFNERFWIPGGNPDLKPETSWNEEITVYFDKYISENISKTGIYFTLFNSNVDNWILWVPDDEVLFLWTPENVQKVWARGMEIEGKLNFRMGQIETRTGLQYTYTKSTNQVDLDDSYEKQLIYVPIHAFSANILFNYRNTSLSYDHNYTGERYTLIDNSEYLPAYNVGRVVVNQRINIKKTYIILQFNINNIWNAQYQAIQYYPMPGRNYEIRISFGM